MISVPNFWRKSVVDVVFITSWDHTITVDTLILAALLKNHGSSPQSLAFDRYTNVRPSMEAALLGTKGLTNLRLRSYVEARSWPLDLVVNNFRVLRHLQIGSEVDLALIYARDGSLGAYRSDRTRELVEGLDFMYLDVHQHSDDEQADPNLRLESLHLCGFDLNMLVEDLDEPMIDFNNLGTLVLESCAGLDEALGLLMGAEVAPSETLGALRLHSFVIRHENATDDFMLELEAFLVSLKPLTKLHALLEGDQQLANLPKVLKVHGKTLGSLIWDQRTGPRKVIEEDTSIFPNDIAHLRAIAKYCTNLKSLGN